jgi:acetoin utilization deacetylase AcuC-like enzyme
MVARSGSFSPSAAKPLQVVESWRRRGFPIEIHEPVPVTVDELSRVHDRRHVVAILAGKAENGFGNRSREVAASLPFTSGSMLSAARHVIDNGGVAAAPSSGFHHAGYDYTAGFCTFNGLMVTAAALLAEGLVRKVGIVDCDMHYGDGTEEIIERLGARGSVSHFTAGGDFHSPEQAEAFFERLVKMLEEMRDCDLLLYQAGADPDVDDPLGGWLETSQLLRRDRIVFEQAARMGIPLVWNLAGGYQVEDDGSIPKVLEIHDNTMEACVRAYGLQT